MRVIDHYPEDTSMKFSDVINFYGFFIGSSLTVATPLVGPFLYKTTTGIAERFNYKK